MRGFVRVLLCVPLALGACTSATLPGGGTPLDQLDKANQAQVDVALRSAFMAEEAHRAQFDVYTTDLGALGVQVPPEVTLLIIHADAAGFCVQAKHTALDAPFHVTNQNPTAAQGACP